MTSQAQSGREIERKFLVEETPPNLSPFLQAKIVQGYIALNGKDEVRIRQRNGDCTLTVKRGSGRNRAEEEVELSEGLFEELWPYTEGFRIYKVRYEIPFESSRNPIELDAYERSLHGLQVAEIEFETEAEADEFVPPAWLGLEVTDYPAYKNRALATRTSPPEELSI